jgi:acetylornithine deacetylase
MTTGENSLEIRPEKLRRLLRRLIDIYSPSGKEEEILAYLHGYLKRHDVPVVRQRVDESRYNLVVVPPESDVRLALVGHLDTVVAYDLEHYGYEEDADLITGLGAADMKGGCAALVEAYLTLWKAGLQGLPVALALVVGEEEEGDGAERLVEEFHFPWALVGEPTDLCPCLSHYGYLEVQLCAQGRRVHASLAKWNQNPVESMLHLLLQVSHYLVNERPEVVYNIRELLSTQAGFAVPDWCEAWLDVHLPPNAPIGEIAQELEDMLERARKENSRVETSLRLTTVHAGYELPEKGRVVEALRDIYGNRSLPWEPRAFPSHSDANQLWSSGVKPILLGPGQLGKAHAPDESVPFQQVQVAAEIYRDLMLSMVS